MNRTRQLIILGCVVPVALILGYCLATPDRTQALTIVGLVIAVMLIPLSLHFHQPILLFSWNLAISLWFIRGKPTLWMLMAGISLGIVVLNRILNKEFRFQHVPSVSWSLFFLLLVVLVTAKLTGGIGLRALGSEVYGGRKFVFILAAIVGYFAISALPIPDRKVQRYTGLFLLSGTSALLPHLIYWGGPTLWILFLLFPSDFALTHAVEDLSLTYSPVTFSRLTGVTFACLAVFNYLTARYGLAGVLNLRKPFRLAVLLLTLVLSLLGGYRSVILIFLLVCGFQFYFERLYNTRLLPIVLVVAVVFAAVLIPSVSKLPLSVQRSLSIFPLDIDPVARANAQASIEWRLEMWRTLVPQVKTYFWVGKGYAVDPSDLYLAEESARRGFKHTQGAVVTGDYHSGPLSVIIPFGIVGVIAFLAFIVVSIRVLYYNYKFSDPSRQTINTFLLSYFVARALFFVIGMGALSTDMPLFAGLVGFSVALNRGMRQPAPATAPSRETINALNLAPSSA